MLTTTFSMRWVMHELCHPYLHERSWEEGSKSKHINNKKLHGMYFISPIRNVSKFCNFGHHQ